MSPVVLRYAIKVAGNIVKPQEVENVLSYAISDQQYDQLHGLYLLLLANQTVQQCSWRDSQRFPGKQYFTYRDVPSQAIYELLPAGTTQPAKRSDTLAW